MADAAQLPWLDEPLARALSAQRGHALLVDGPAGVGQFEFCLRLAQAWLCEHPATVDAPNDLPQACGTCGSCHLMAAQAHPDLLVIVPDALREGLGWRTGDDATEAESTTDGKKTKPSAEIKVDAIRRAVAFAQHTSARGVGKVLAIYPAERMNTIAANTLLKTLEEPPGLARFVLATSRAEGLLPTIRSRCQSFRLPLPDTPTATAWLEQQGIIEPHTLLAAGGGEPLTARELARQGVQADTWINVPRWVCSGHAQPLLAWPMPLLVDTLQKLCFDTTLKTLGQTPRYFPDSNVPAGAQISRLTAWATALRKAKRHAEHPLNAVLQVENLLFQAQQALYGAVLPPAR